MHVLVVPHRGFPSFFHRSLHKSSSLSPARPAEIFLHLRMAASAYPPPLTHTSRHVSPTHFADSAVPRVASATLQLSSSGLLLQTLQSRFLCLTWLASDRSSAGGHRRDGRAGSTATCQVALAGCSGACQVAPPCRMFCMKAAFLEEQDGPIGGRVGWKGQRRRTGGPPQGPRCAVDQSSGGSSEPDSGDTSQVPTLGAGREGGGDGGESVTQSNVQIPLDLPRRRVQLSFTCDRCETRTTRMVNPVAVARGTVFVQCAQCEVYHQLVDNLGLIVEYDFRKEAELERQFEASPGEGPQDSSGRQDSDEWNAAS